MREFVNQADQVAVMDFIVACFDSFVQTDQLSRGLPNPRSWHPFSPFRATRCNICSPKSEILTQTRVNLSSLL